MMLTNTLTLGRAFALAGALGIAAFACSSADASTILYSDDFTGTNGASFDGNTTPVSPFGVSALESYGDTLNPRINVDRLQTDDGSSGEHEGLAFGGTSSRFNWATSSFASTLVSDGLTISFDARGGNGGDYVSLGFGSFTGVPDGTAGFGAIYDSSDMDWGYRAEPDRAISFLADGTTTPSVIESFTSVGNFAWYHVEIDLQFPDFNAGSTVTAVARVYEGQGNGGTLKSTINDTFMLGATDNFVFDISFNENSNEILFDNLVISTPGLIPEPCSLALLGLGGLALAGVRRRG